MSETRTPAKPGKDTWQQWPAEVTVEYGPVETGTVTNGVAAKTYPVFLDGERIGEIKAARERTYRKVAGMGSIRQATGYANRWRARPRSGSIARPGVDLHYTSRAEATAVLVKFVLDQRTAR